MSAQPGGSIDPLFSLENFLPAGDPSPAPAADPAANTPAADPEKDAMKQQIEKLTAAQQAAAQEAERQRQALIAAINGQQPNQPDPVQQWQNTLNDPNAVQSLIQQQVAAGLAVQNQELQIAQTLQKDHPDLASAQRHVRNEFFNIVSEHQRQGKQITIQDALNQAITNIRKDFNIPANQQGKAAQAAAIAPLSYDPTGARGQTPSSGATNLEAYLEKGIVPKNWAQLRAQRYAEIS